MSEEVKIVNVGRDGVASEATLQSLASKFERSGKLDKENLRTLEKFGKEAKSSGEELGKLSKAAKKAKEGLASLAKESAFGGTRAGDFAEALFGASNMATRLITYGDELVDTFRTLSSVGASLNNNIFDLVTYSAESALTLDQFSEIVRDNSETLAMLGGTVTEGAKRFAKLSNELRTGVGSDLFNLGFTIEELNEGLLNYIDLERMRSYQNLRTDREMIMGANEYLKTLDELSKVTGKSRDQIAAGLEEQLTDARIAGQVARLRNSGQEEAAKNLEKSMAFLKETMGPELMVGIVDAMDGVIQTDMGRVMSQQLGPAAMLMIQDIFKGKKPLEETVKGFGALAERAEQFRNSLDPAALQYYKDQGDSYTAAMATLADNTWRFSKVTGRDVQAAIAEQKKRENITEFLAKFEQMITDFRTGFTRFITEVFGKGGKGSPFIKAITDATTAISNLIGTADTDGFNGLKKILSDATKAITPLFGEKGTFTTGVQAFTKWINEGGIQKTIDSATAKLEEFSTYLKTTFYNDGKFVLFQGLHKIFDAALDGIVNILVGDGDDTGGSTGLIDRIFAKLTDGMDSATGGEGLFQKVVDSASIVFDSIFDSFKKLVFGPKTDTKNSLFDLFKVRASYLYDEFKERVFGPGAAKKSLSALLVAEFNKFVDSTKLSLTKIDKKLAEVFGLGEGKTFSEVLMEWVVKAADTVADVLEKNIPGFLRAMAQGFRDNAEMLGKAIGTVLGNIPKAMATANPATVADERDMSTGEKLARSATGTGVMGSAEAFISNYMEEEGASRKEAIDAWYTKEARALINKYKHKPGEKDDTFWSTETITSLFPGQTRSTKYNVDLKRLEGIVESLRQNNHYTGTGGKFVNFGSGTPAMLHGREMVVPENDIGTAVQALTGSSVNGNIDTMKQLNSNVQVMIKLLATQNAISNQQLRATKGMGNDYYRGVMR